MNGLNDERRIAPADRTRSRTLKVGEWEEIVTALRAIGNGWLANKLKMPEAEPDKLAVTDALWAAPGMEDRDEMEAA